MTDGLRAQACDRKTISLSLLDSHGEISTSACDFDNEEVLVTVDINLRETVVIESRQW